MRTGVWKITYTLEDESFYPDDLSEATLDHVAEMVKEGYTSGEINEPEMEEYD